MALDDQKLITLANPDFGEDIVRRALVMAEKTGETLDRALPILGQAFLQAVEERLPFEDLSSDEEAAIRDAVRTHLNKLRISGERIPRRKGMRLLVSAANFHKEQSEAIHEFAGILQIDLFVEALKNKILISRLLRKVEATELIAARRAVDPLLNIPTRLYGAEKVRLKVEGNPAKPLGILIIDVDHFKRVNDTLGHKAGDTVLKNVAKIIRVQIHMDDIVLRYGGEEILIILDVDNKEQVLKVAQRLRMAIQSHTSVTVSIGAEFAAGSEILNRGDTIGLTEAADTLIDDADLTPEADCHVDSVDQSDAAICDADELLTGPASDFDSSTELPCRDLVSLDYEYHPGEVVDVALTTSLLSTMVVEVPLDTQSLDFDINGLATVRADEALYKAKGPKTEDTGRNRVWAAWKEEPEPREWIEPEEVTTDF